jgi:hypothetical protein
MAILRKQTFRAARNERGEMEVREARRADLDAGHAAGWVPHGYGAPPTVEIAPDWAMLRPPAETDLARKFGSAMTPVRLVLIALLWATSSPGRAAISTTAVVLLLILIS